MNVYLERAKRDMRLVEHALKKADPTDLSMMDLVQLVQANALIAIAESAPSSVHFTGGDIRFTPAYPSSDSGMQNAPAYPSSDSGMQNAPAYPSSDSGMRDCAYARVQGQREQMKDGACNE